MISTWSSVQSKYYVNSFELYIHFEKCLPKNLSNGIWQKKKKSITKQVV